METKPARVTRGKGLLEGYLARRRADEANRRIPQRARAGRVLDVGCGASPYFLTNTHFGLRVGVDQTISPAWQDAMRQGVSLVAWDGEQAPALPFRSASFDAVTMLAVAEHIEPGALVPFLAEANRVLRDGGTVVMTTPPPWSNVLLKVMARVGLISKVEIEEHAQTYSATALARILHQVGFRDVHAGYFELGLNVHAIGSK